ncbi:RHS repeat-associated core domain-containing protein [Pseudomonas sp. B14(2017)]|uniref:RHS repeat-associated core domain-containing protein n=1 Tax=Pseudomonas sp. B14(2017) TaxID=1981745 RepID=UPI000A1E0F3F|nr:RHS repeat-associated core domain-containing protein [Pseudomonas sp. B14(2017)]
MQPTSEYPFYTLEGAPQSRAFAYTPYGYLFESSALLGFNGERADPITGYYLLGNGRRAFNPILMRFNSPDSMSPFGLGEVNSYSYCLHDPLNYQDPSGNSRVGRFVSGLYGRVVGRKQRPDIRREIFPAIHASVTPLLKASIKPFGRKSGPGKLHLKKEMEMLLVSESVDVEGYDFLGYHGSSKIHKQSLMNGLDINKNTVRMYGPGFYISPNLDVAERFAWIYERGYVYGVYGKSPGVNEYVEKYAGGKVAVIREGGFKYVMVRDFILNPLAESASEVRR